MACASSSVAWSTITACSRGEPLVVGLAHVAHDRARSAERSASARASSWRLASTPGAMPRLVDRLLEDELRLLLVRPQQLELLVLDPRKARRLPVGDQHLVESRVNGVQQVGRRKIDRATAVGHAVTRGEIDHRQIARPGLVERGETLLDAGRSCAQLEVGSERIVDEPGESLFDAGRCGGQVSLDRGTDERRKREQPPGEAKVGA